MVTLSNEVAAAGFRANKFTRYYPTVAQMLGTSDTWAVGEVIEAGDFRYTVAATDATDHHLTAGNGSKLYAPQTGHGFDVRAFGALCDGSTDDTAALNLAMAAADAEDAPILIVGSMVFDPSTTELDGNNTNTWFIRGSLRPTTTIEFDNVGWTLIGLGGTSLSAFGRGSVAEIIPPAGNIPVFRLLGEGRRYFRNLYINECYIGVQLVESDITNISAFADFDNVSIVASPTGLHALEITSLFWGWFRNCFFSARNISNADAKSIRVTGLGVGKFGGFGLTYFEDCITAGGGIKIDGTAIDQVAFKRHVHETLPSGQYVFEVAAKVALFDDVVNADPLSGSLGLFNLRGTGFAEIRGPSEAMTAANLPDSLRILGGGPNASFFPAYRDIWDRPSFVAGMDGILTGRMSNRVFSPYISSGAASTYLCDFSTGTGQGSAGTVTSTAVLAPDGTTTAIKGQSVGGTSGQDLFSSANTSSFTVAEGDTVIAGCAIRSADGSNPQGVVQFFLNGLDGQTFTAIVSDKPGGGHTVHFTGMSSGLVNEGGTWVAAAAWFHITSLTGTVNTTAKFAMDLNQDGDEPDNSLTVWRPWVMHLRAADGYTLADGLKLLSASHIRENLPAGVTGTLSHHMFRTGLGATGSRPSNPVAGCQWYDTTLGQPIWYDGTNWTDAAGTTV